MITPLPLPPKISTETTAGETRAVRASMCRCMVLRSATEAGAFPVKAEGRSTRRTRVGWGVGAMAKAFVSGAGFPGAILTESGGRLVRGGLEAAAEGATAFDASTAKRTASSQHAGLARKNSTARMKLTASCPTPARFSLAGIRCSRQYTITVTRLSLWSRWTESGHGSRPARLGHALAFVITKQGVTLDDFDNGRRDELLP
jgi:hypothetical protein